MAIKAVLCDVDDVIRHWRDDPIAAAERAHGVEYETLARAMFARDLLYPACAGEITAGDWMGRAANRLLETGLSHEAALSLVQAWRSRPFWIDQQVMDWLAAARRRMPVWLLTNQMDDFAEAMAGAGVLERMDGVINSADVGVPKPEPEIYRIAAGKVGVPLEHCLFIDDRSENIDAAAELGMTTVLYRSFGDLHGVLDD
ncbi:MAG TPA: HAD-IA family hydrolase [Jiangellaceae bacterium]